MNRSRWTKISDILEAVLEQDEKERSEYLTQICGGDTDLRQEIESLLSFQHTIENDVFERNQLNPLFYLTIRLFQTNISENK